MLWKVFGYINISFAVFNGPFIFTIGGKSEWGLAIFGLIVGIWLIEDNK